MIRLLTIAGIAFLAATGRLPDQVAGGVSAELVAGLVVAVLMVPTLKSLFE